VNFCPGCGGGECFRDPLDLEGCVIHCILCAGSCSDPHCEAGEAGRYCQREQSLPGLP
jgi:hypothetical protein